MLGGRKKSSFLIRNSFYDNKEMDQTSFDDLLRIQRMMASKIIDETSMDEKIKLLDIVNDLATGKNKQIAIEHIIIEGQAEGLQENEVMMLLDQLKNDGMLVDKGDGFIQLLR